MCAFRTGDDYGDGDKDDGDDGDGDDGNGDNGDGDDGNGDDGDGDGDDCDGVSDGDYCTKALRQVGWRRQHYHQSFYRLRAF